MAALKLILRQDLSGLGKRGDIIEVAPGYGRNYLLPRGLAMVASDGAVAQAAQMRQARDLRDAQSRESAQSIASTLVPKIIEIHAKAGAEGKLFGSVTGADIVEAIAEQTEVEIDRKQLEFETIRTVGQHTVTAHLHRDVSFPIRIDVQPTD